MITEELQVYKDTYKLLNTVVDLIPNYPKEFKFTIGDKLLLYSVTLVDNLQFANRVYGEERKKYLNDFLANFGVVTTLIRLSAEKKFISSSKQAELILLTDSIGRQISGWKNSIN